MTQQTPEEPELFNQLIKETRALMLSNDIYWLKYYQGEDSNSVRDWEDKVRLIPDLHYAAHDGKLDKIKYLLNNKGSINQRISDGAKLLRTRSKYVEEYIGFFRGSTPLMMASQAGHEKVVKHLVNHGALVNMSDNVGIRAFTWACISNHIGICKFLMSKGADIDMKEDRFGMTPFLLACQSNHIKVVKILVKNGVDTNTKSFQGQNALHFAALNKNAKLIKYLTKRGLNVNMQDNARDTPLHLLLSNHSFDPDNVDDSWSAKEQNQLRNIFQMMNQNGDVTIDIKRETRSCDSSTTSQTDGWYALKALVDLGANLNMKNNEGRTPLHTLISNLPAAVCSRGYIITNNPVANQLMFVQMLILLKKGVDLSLTDSNGQTVLDYCHDVSNMMAFKILDRYADRHQIQIELFDVLKYNIEAFGLKFSEKEVDFEAHIQWISDVILTGPVTGLRALIPSREQIRRWYLQVIDWIEINWAPLEF